MEAAVSNGGSIAAPSSQHPHRKERRTVSEHSFHHNGGEELEQAKFGQSDERTIYEEVTGPLDVDFCSITIDGGGLTNETLQGRLQEVSRQREELERLEMELRAQAIARTETMEMQRRFQSQIREHVDAIAQLKDRLKQREQHISELKVTLEEKDRELRSVKIDNEAVWAKEDLLREQNQELATFRRELDNSEVERAQHAKQIHDLQEHAREKESQFLALEEQHRVARETIHYKDEQLREAQAWISRVQMDALQSTANQSLQAELRERTEQFNQYWIALQRQFVEMERHHIQTIQQIHLELAEARGNSEIYKDGSRITHEDSTDSSSHLQKGHQMNPTTDGISNSALTQPSNGDFSTSSSSINTEHASGVPVLTSLLGMGTFVPAGQMAAFRPFVMHPQGVPHAPSSTNPIISQSYLGNVLPASPVPAQQYWPNQQVMLNQNKCNISQLEQNPVGSDSHFTCELSADGIILQEYHANSQNNEQQSSFPAVNGGPNEEIQVPEISSKQYQIPQKTREISAANAHLNAILRCETTGQRTEREDHSILSSSEAQEPVTTSTQQCLTAIIDTDTAPSNAANSNSAAEYNRAILVSSETTISTTQESSLMTNSKAMDHTLLDERALLACIVRAIPAGSVGRIRISTTLPNRLGKMLAPLHWHDYKKHYGKLDDFVSHHPELFVIEGDFIHLREGAQEIISATTAVAKVAAAAAASAVSYSSLASSVAVTPVSQGNRQKKSSVESKSVNSLSYLDSYDRLPANMKFSRQPQNGISLNVVQEMLDVSFSNKTKNYELNGLTTEMSTTTQPTASNLVGNGSNRGLTNVRHVFGGKQQGRSAGTGVMSRR